MKKKLFIALLFVITSSSLFSQIYEPIKWSTELKKTSETSANVIIRATIEDGWHLYGLNIPKDGPRATTIVFDKIENAQKKRDSRSTLKIA
jgi:thiol:disulfide interchange protein DsbD